MLDLFSRMIILRNAYMHNSGGSCNQDDLKVQIMKARLKIFVERYLHAHQTTVEKRNLLNVDQKARSSPRSLPYLPRRVGRYATASFFDNLSEPPSKERTDG